MAKKGKSAATPLKKSTPKASKSLGSKGDGEVPFGLDAIEQFNAEREEVEPTNLDEEEEEDEEETLGLDGLSDEDDYDWEGEEEEDIPEYDFDEEEYDRKEIAKQKDEEDADILGRRGDRTERPFAERLTAKEVYTSAQDKGDDVEEAKRLQKEYRSAQSLEDFDIDTTPVVKTSTKSKEEKLLDSFNADLENIDLGKAEVEKISKKISAKDKEANLKEKLARLKEESPELLNLLKEFKEKLHEVHNVIQPILEKAKKNEIPTTEGISFLEVKNQLLLSYCINISFYLMLKAQGKQVKDHPVVDQLVRIRAIMEKAKPIEKKLSYQIDKLLRTANLGIAAGGDADLTERPNPADLEVDSEDEMADKRGVYRAPRGTEEIMETTVTKEDKRLEKEKKRKKNSEIAQFMRDVYGDAPEESTPGLASDAFEQTAYDRELAELEELNMRRKDVTRADKRQMRLRMEGMNEVLSGRMDFRDLAVYEDDPEKKKDEAYLAQKRMRAHMDMVDDRKRAVKNKIHGDEETHTQPKKAKMNQQGALGRGFLFDEEIESEEEMEERRPRFEAGGVPHLEEEMEEGTKRKATKKIEANKGLVKPRNKDIKTPHLRQRKRVQKRLAKLGGHQKIRSQDKPFTGVSRVAKNVVRSKKYTD
eukprot:Phypoly_transcript_05153.p1 GENE.Phypoly_transcript_05153~~Phypoly_transcript_05153.p1  ORF type:complete len:668 (+),score=182.99 Phypoly_transcript_05153:65-2005(+)